MPNGVKKSQKTAHAARVRAMKKQREADEAARIAAEKEEQIYRNTPIVSPEHHEVMMKFARRLAGEVRGWESLHSIATEDAPKLVWKGGLHEVASKRYATFIARNWKVICPVLNRANRANGKIYKGMGKMPLDDRISMLSANCREYKDGGCPLWKALLDEADLNLRFCGNQHKLYLAREDDPLLADGIMEKFGTNNCDPVLVGKDVVMIIWKMVFDPPKIAKEEDGGDALWKIHVGCFGSMWIDIDIDRGGGDIWQYRISITNKVYNKNLVKGAAPAVCGYSKKFNPHFIIRPR